MQLNNLTYLSALYPIQQGQKEHSAFRTQYHPERSKIITALSLQQSITTDPFQKKKKRYSRATKYSYDI